jgi:hypothetical protein
MTEHEAKQEAYRILTRREPWKPTIADLWMLARVVLYTGFFIIGIMAYVTHDSMTAMYTLASLAVMGEVFGNLMHRAVEVERKMKKISADLQALQHDTERHREYMERIVNDLERQHRRR